MHVLPIKKITLVWYIREGMFMVDSNIICKHVLFTLQ